MNICETVKAAVTTRMAAERYGLRVERGGMDLLAILLGCRLE